MEIDPGIYRGCLLGMAVGDALGAAVDGKSYRQICETYGPAGLLGYDLVNGYAEVSSHTQIAAFTCNTVVELDIFGVLIACVTVFIPGISLLCEGNVEECERFYGYCLFADCFVFVST